MASSSASDSSVSQSSACSTGGACASFFALRMRACSKSEITSGTQPQSQVGACFAGGSAVDGAASLAAIARCDLAAAAHLDTQEFRRVWPILELIPVQLPWYGE